MFGASNLKEPFILSKDLNGNNAVDFWIKFYCYRKSKSQYENCLIHEEFVFNQNNQIISVKEIELKEDEFSFYRN
jgi:hypothetical protein